MAKYVFILGAGASADAGAPMMRDFLDVADDLRMHDPQVDKDSFDLVFRGIKALRRAHSNAVLDVRNVESVFAAFEMAALISTLGDLKSEDVEKLPNAIRTLIIETIERRFRFRLDDAKRLCAPVEYERLAHLIGALRDRGDTACVITFNYDLGMDLALFRQGVPYTYGLADDLQTPKVGSMPLLKLHGSLNWTEYLHPRRILPIYIEEMERRGVLLAHDNDVTIPFSKHLETARAGGAPRTGRAVIVPPTWSKMQEYQAIASCWRRAATELDDAQRIYISGFSLPATDNFFPLLFALGTSDSASIKDVCVFDPALDVHDRFRNLLGQATVERFRGQQSTFYFAVTQTLPDDLQITRPGNWPMLAITVSNPHRR